MLTAFLQNLIGNILNFNTLYQNIVNANNSSNYRDVYFYVGRLVYLVVYFDPMIDSALQTKVPENTFERFLLNEREKFILQDDKKEPATVWTIVYDLPINFLNGSIGISSANSSVCISNITSLNSSVSLLIS